VSDIAGKGEEQVKGSVAAVSVSEEGAGGTAAQVAALEALDKGEIQELDTSQRKMITDAEERAGAASGGMGSEEGKRLWAAFRDDKSAVGATQGEHDNGPRFKGTQTEDRQGGDAMTSMYPHAFFPFHVYTSVLN
jgi:hypothetical protein